MALDLTVLNTEQRLAVEQLEGPCMIIAGAGSGKTRVLTYKIANLIESGVNPFDILALTFTNKAANEMKERVKVLAGNIADRIWMGTFHSIFSRILRFEAEKIGFTRNYTIYDANDSLNVFKAVMQSLEISPEKTNPKGVQSVISMLKNKLVFPQEFADSARTFYEKLIARIYPEYQKTLLRSNSMDFDDLLVKPVELFTFHTEVLEKYQERFKFVLVDEYQDTNKAQYYIVKLLSAKHKNISVVGDDAQSIYKWRGAEIQNIFDFESDYENRKLFRLEQNYRSTKKILSFAGMVIKNNRKQIEKKLWTSNKDGEDVILLESMTDKEEAAKVSKQISQEIHDKKLKFKDFAVLYRTNAQSRLLEDSLRQNGIPYIIVGGIRFYQRKEIKDILCVLRIIVNPKDDESMRRFIDFRPGIGKTTVEKLFSIAEENNLQLYDVLEKLDEYSVFSGRTRNLLTEVLNFIRKYQFLKPDMAVSEFVRSVIDETGILNELRLENTDEATERISNIQEFISAVADFEENSDAASLEDFLQQVSLVADIDELDNQKNAVTLMTIHAAKGLEFPVIFVAGLEDGLFPVSGSFDGEEELEEERRLFYVAITRAKQNLYLLFANQRYKFGVLTYQIKSRFLKEVIDDAVGQKILTYHHHKLQRHKRESDFLESHIQKVGKSIVYEYFNSEDNYKGAENDSFADIRKGINVYHNIFGKGVVITVSGKSNDKRAEILFEDIGMKKIILKYAKMRVEV